MKYVHMELKVCESCGMLWLRLKELHKTYCPGCVLRLASFPAATGRHAGGRPRTRRPHTRTATPRHVGCAAAAGGRTSSGTTATAPRASQAGAR